ncbi:MAG: ATP-dependent DNA ligase [Desulfurococcaceae archaeon]
MSIKNLTLKDLAELFVKIEGQTSRTVITNMVVDLFRRTPPEIIDKVVYLMQGLLYPDWVGNPELGVGEKLLIKSIALSCRVSEETVERMYKQLGDLGKVAEKLKESAKSSGKAVSILSFTPETRIEGLNITDVYNRFVKIAMAQGEGSKDLKIKILAGLLSEATPVEAKFIVKFVEGALRLGIGEATIMDALAITFGDGIGSRPFVERAYNLRPDLGEIAKLLATRGIEELKNIKPRIGIPIRPMLAERLNDPRAIISKVGGEAFVEFKYDGERAQIHKSGDKVIIFSRRLENITYQYPDVVELVKNNVKANEAIIEGEIVAYDPDTGELKPFQELMRRKRKYDIHIAMKEVPVKVYLFDVLYVDNEDYTVKPLPERRRKLEEIIVENENFAIAEYIKTSSPEDLEKFFLESIEKGAEGVMVKALHSKSIYQAGVRGWLWIKYKRDYKSEMADSVDLVVVGAFYGRGRRGGKFGTLLMASYNNETGFFETVCKVGTGFKDEDLNRMNEILLPYVTSDKPVNVIANIKPDVWIRPALVAEIIGAELTLSPLHTCGLNIVKQGVGISIRFPRFIRWRPDKGPEEATTTREIIDMYNRQLKKIVE